MNWEVLKVANGYMIRPAYNLATNSCGKMEDVYVFNKFEQMADKLHELLHLGMKRDLANTLGAIK